MSNVKNLRPRAIYNIDNEPKLSHASINIPFLFFSCTSALIFSAHYALSAFMNKSVSASTNVSLTPALTLKVEKIIASLDKGQLRHSNVKVLEDNIDALEAKYGEKAVSAAAPFIVLHHADVSVYQADRMIQSNLELAENSVPMGDITALMDCLALGIC